MCTPCLILILKCRRLLCIAQKEVLILDSVGEHIYTLCTTPSLPLTDCCYCPKFKLYVTARYA